jgi:hypothetical protein
MASRVGSREPRNHATARGSLRAIAFSATFKGTNRAPGIATRDVQRGTIAAPSRAATRLTIVCFSSATWAILGVSPAPSNSFDGRIVTVRARAAIGHDQRLFRDVE